MTNIKHSITVRATLELDEIELRALDAMAGYGTDQFLDAFYEKMGRAYLGPYEKGIRRLFQTIRRDVPEAIGRVDMARKFLADKGPQE